MEYLSHDKSDSYVRPVLLRPDHCTVYNKNKPGMGIKHTYIYATQTICRSCSRLLSDYFKEYKN